MKAAQRQCLRTLRSGGGDSSCAMIRNTSGVRVQRSGLVMGICHQQTQDLTDELQPLPPGFGCPASEMRVR